MKHGTMNTNNSQMNYRVGFISLGCAKTLVNSEQMMFLLREAGCGLTVETQDADAVVVNTCAFIESAKMEAIETILALGRLKETGRLKKIIVAGCLPERYKNEIIKEMPEIDTVVGTGGFQSIVAALRAAMEGHEEQEFFDDINAPVSETSRIISTPSAWAYLKIAEGCDNHCAYCVIPSIRGRFRSRSADAIVDEARNLVENGRKELIVVAQDVTRYGLDIYGKKELATLLDSLSTIGGLSWIRLHYLYPSEINDELIDEIARNDKILKYLDIPIQHINDDILRKMNRRGTGDEIRSLLRRLRERVPGVVLRTSLITGLPGEGDIEFAELCDFLKESKIERAGVFAYSPEEGSPAALMDSPDLETAIARAEILTDIQSEIIDEFNISRIGSVVAVLVEGSSDGIFFGRSFAESPDVDGYINIRGKGIVPGEMIGVRITGVENHEPMGVRVEIKDRTRGLK